MYFGDFETASLMQCLKANEILILKLQAGDTVIYPNHATAFGIH